MVSELAPLVLFSAGYRSVQVITLIIEEPEAHLHPGAQAKIAHHPLLDLIRAGVRVIDYDA